MGMTGGEAQLRALRRNLADLARPGGKAHTEIGRSVAKEVKGVLKTEFADGTAPDGSTWTPTKGGKQALLSRKIPSSFVATVMNDDILFASRIPWLNAHQTGHTWPARHAGGGQVFFDANNKFISSERARKLSGKKTKAVESGADLLNYYRNRRNKETKERYAELVAKSRSFAAHVVTAHTLPQRLIYPDNSDVPAPWATAIERGVREPVMRWAGKATE